MAFVGMQYQASVLDQVTRVNFFMGKEDVWLEKDFS